MSGSKRSQNVVDLMRNAPATTERQLRQIDACDANGCPLPGTIKNESGERVCAAHFGANKKGWPKTTAVTVRTAELWLAARDAATVGLPEAMSAKAAKALFDAAKLFGIEFNELQRDQYRTSPMKLKAAGMLVEAAINAQAVVASGVAEHENRQPQHEQNETRFIGVLNLLSDRFTGRAA